MHGKKRVTVSISFAQNANTLCHIYQFEGMDLQRQLKMLQVLRA